jgi:hypothetical protein
MRHTSYAVIGLCGYKGSGKDTVGGYLERMYGFERRAFATKMKEAVAALFDITVEQVDMYKGMESEIPLTEVILEHGTTQHSWTWREFMQRFGTEMGRNVFGPDFWVNLAMSTPMTRPTVFTDVRFANELRGIKAIGGKIVWIERAGYGSDGHASEQKPSLGQIDYVIHNNSDHVDLYELVEEMVGILYGMEPEHEHV